MSISQLPPDYFAGILSKIHGIHVYMLWQTGDKRLQRLIDNLETFEWIWDDNEVSRWPASMLKSMHRLKHVAFKTTEEYNFVNIVHPELSALGKGLESLDFRFPAHLLELPQSLAEMLPQLTTLRCLVARPWSMEEFIPLPPSLTELELGFAKGDAMKLPPTLVPPNLTSLALTSPFEIEEPPVHWPTQLRKLKMHLKATSGIERLAHLLPSSLVELSLHFLYPVGSQMGNMFPTGTEVYPVIWAKSLPSMTSLESLEIVILNVSSTHIRALPAYHLLPPSLTKIHIAHPNQYLFSDDSTTAATWFPRNLPCLQFFNYNKTAETLQPHPDNPLSSWGLQEPVVPVQSLKAVCFAPCLPLVLLDRLPPGMTSLRISDRSAHPTTEGYFLPPTLLELELEWNWCEPTQLEVALPSSLTVLKLSHAIMDLAPPARGFPPGLTHLEMVLSRLPCLSVLPRTLKHLTLKQTDPYAINVPQLTLDTMPYVSSEFWDATLPRHLEHLEATAFASAHLPLLRLASSRLLPELKSLKIKNMTTTLISSSPKAIQIRADIQVEIQTCANPLRDFSSSLRRLRLPLCSLNFDWLEELPKTVKRLSLKDFDNNLPALSSRHLEMLPPKLARLSAQVSFPLFSHDTLKKLEGRTKYKIDLRTTSGLPIGPIRGLSLRPVLKIPPAALGSFAGGQQIAPPQ